MGAGDWLREGNGLGGRGIGGGYDGRSDDGGPSRFCGLVRAGESCAAVWE